MVHAYVRNQESFLCIAGISTFRRLQLHLVDTRMGNEHEISHYHEPVFKLNEQVGIGINLNRFFAGAMLIASQTMENQGDNPIREQQRYMTFNVFVGYRFGAFKFLRRTFDKVEGLVK